MIKNYQHIIWDWNGTLVDDVWLCIEIINEMLENRQKPTIDHNHYRTIFDFPVKGYYLKAGFSFDIEPFEALATEFCGIYDQRVSECTLFEQSARILNAMAERGISQSILSATEQNALNQMVDHFDVGHYFRQIIGQDNHHAIGKVESGRRLLNQLGVEGNQVLLIGDTQHDHEVASQIGVDCLLIASGHHSKERLLGVHHQVVESLGELLG